MENASKASFFSPDYETAAEESISMYFSFNSTLAADKTMEADQFKSEACEKEYENNLKTVIKKVSGSTPVHAISKNILQELKMFSSTPARKLNIDQMENGLSALGLAPLDPLKKNTTDSEQVSNDCGVTCKTMEIQSQDKIEFDAYIEHNNSSEVNTNGDSSNTNVSDHVSIPSIIVIDCSGNSFDCENISKDKRKPLSTKKICENIEINAKDNESSFKKVENDLDSVHNSNSKNSKDLPIIIEISDCSSDDENKENQCFHKIPASISASKKLSIGDKKCTQIDSVKMKESKNIPVAKKRLSLIQTRKSIVPSEPDLTRNKPSRIFDKKLTSLATSSKLSPSQFTTQIPRFLSKIVEGNPGTIPKTNTSREQKVSMLKKPINRKSLLPRSPNRKDIRRTVSIQPTNKRLSIINQKSNAYSQSPKIPRKSNIMKTTLNSPRNIRRNVRKSLAPEPSRLTATNTMRKSMLPAVNKNTMPTKRLLNSPNKLHLKKLEPDNSTEQKNTQIKSTAAAPISRDNFICEKCSRTFRLLSSLEAHKKIHLIAVTSPPICKYCDKKFAIPKALQNHLLEKCPKIPTADKKKLLYSSTTPEETTAPKSANVIRTMSKPNKPSLSASSTHSTDSSVVSVNPSDVSQVTDTKSMPPPPPSSKSKRKIMQPHSGVYRTPNKPVVCHPCKKTFDNILNFTEHVLLHSSSDPDS